MKKKTPQPRVNKAEKEYLRLDYVREAIKKKCDEAYNQALDDVEKEIMDSLHNDMHQAVLYDIEQIINSLKRSK